MGVPPVALPPAASMRRVSQALPAAINREQRKKLNHNQA